MSAETTTPKPIRSRRASPVAPPPEASVPVLLTLEEVCILSRAPMSTVRDWIASAKLASRRPGRRRLVHRRDLAAFLGLGEHELVLAQVSSPA